MQTREDEGDEGRETRGSAQWGFEQKVSCCRIYLPEETAGVLFPARRHTPGGMASALLAPLVFDQVPLSPNHGANGR